MAHKISPLAPERFPTLAPLGGVRFATAETGIRYKNRPDVLLALMDKGTTVAGVYTTSKTRSAPVEWCRAAQKQGVARVLIVNAGNSNAFTGKRGVATVKAVAKAAAREFRCKTSEVFQASTGVIGEPLNPDFITKALPALNAALGADQWNAAARAIMTTDTFAKAARATAKIGRETVTIQGIAKGSGMIAPDMATMLAFVFTDAAIPAKVLQAMLSKSTARTFNCVTVDSDTSTSDTLIAFATGAKPSPKGLKAADPRLKAFAKALDDVCHDLALQVARDGEGAEKLIEISLNGAENDKAAHRIAMSIANSPLVKTAIAGEDANWGRIVMAIGKAGEKANRDKLRIRIGGVQVAAKGMRDPAYKEAEIMPHMKGRHIVIEADVGVGQGKARVWTCDLTHGYIDINGSYRS